MENVKNLVLYAGIPDGDMSSSLYPPERDDEVRACKSERVKQEKYYVWKLLGLAVKEWLNLEIDNFKFTKTDNGKWICPDFCFSLSHTDGAVCVAVSRYPVGVDIERAREIRQTMYSRVLTEREMEHIDSLADDEKNAFFLDAWVKKESLFKRDGGECLNPRKNESLGADAVTHRVTISGSDYLIGLSSVDNENYEIRYMEDI